MIEAPWFRITTSESEDPVYGVRLSDLLARVGVELLDKKGSVRCRSCRAQWTVFNEKGEFFFTSWCCPNRCNSEG